MVYRKKQKINFKYNLKEYFSLVGRYKLIVIVLLLLIFFVESAQTLNQYLFKLIVDKGTAFNSGTIDSSVFLHALIIIALVFIGLFILRAIGWWFHNHLVNTLDANLIKDLKTKYFNHILYLSHGFHTTHKTGSLISRLNRGAGSVERMTDLIVYNAAPLVIQLIVVGVSLWYFNVQSAIIVIVTMLTLCTYSIYIQRIQEKWNIRLNQSEDTEKANIADFFTNIDSIKYFGKEDVVKSKFSKLSNNTKAAEMKNWGYYRWMGFGQTLIIGVGTLFLVYFPLKGFLAGTMTLGTLVFIYTVYLSLLGPLFGFISGVRGFYRSMADFQDLFQYGKIENDIKDKPGSGKLKVDDGVIEFRNVSFNYNKRNIFRDFNLVVPKNKKIALVGHSGSGKTTLVKLLYRFYDVDKGEILIDRVNIKDANQESLRGELSIVPQECVLFDDTIYNNIAFSNPKASRDDVFKAIKFAQLDKIIKEFPDKENTIVGERGVKLSGGEKQRVSIARALLANKKILVLDEATSSLDSQTEHDIQQDLVRLMEGRTSIIIAHRLSTVMKADTIVVLERGRIVQMGSHNQLIKKVGVYKKLWNLQKGGYIGE